MMEFIVEAEIRGVVLGSRVVLRDIGLRVRPGETVVIGGPNGAGKTSLLRALLGLLPIEGTVRIGGHDVRRAHQAAMTQVGYVPQAPALFPEMTVGEHFRLFAALRGLRPSTLSEAVQAFGVSAYLNAYPGTLSGGWLQRVSLALALLGDPPVLVLDEPTAHLDRPTRALLWEVLRRKQAQGVTVLMTTHRWEDRVLEAARYLWLEDGRLVSEAFEPQWARLKAWVLRQPNEDWIRRLPPDWQILRFAPDGLGDSTCVVLRGPWASRWQAVQTLQAGGNAVIRIDWLSDEGEA
ncbi:MAG: ABC transporter ATP-binding protein [Acidobacteria bacterium]|nr:ABC transporter ATP-binding protein [Acidobacteriota bacterium]MDW7984587.1 ABC transporter ATP-binding protein [Acidobacteriota bacterium]